MADSSSNPLFNVDLNLLSEALSSLAEDMDFLVCGEGDNLSGRDFWERRVNAGLHMVRIRAILNNGELDLAAVDFSTLETLSAIWQSISLLRYGDHLDDPASYGGPLFLPGEVKPDGSIVSADEKFCTLAGLLPEDMLEKARSLGDNSLFQTKEEHWDWFPDELREYARMLSPANLVAFCSPKPAAAGSGIPLVGVLDIGSSSIEKAPATGDVEWLGPKSPSDWEKVFDLSWKTIRRRIDKGEFRAIEINSKSWKIAADDVPKKPSS